MDRHKRVPVAKRPLGVNIMMAGGLKGYSGCKIVQKCVSLSSKLRTEESCIMLLNLLQPYLQENAACLCTNPLYRVSQEGLPEENAILHRPELQ